MFLYCTNVFFVLLSKYFKFIFVFLFLFHFIILKVFSTIILCVCVCLVSNCYKSCPFFVGFNRNFVVCREYLHEHECVFCVRFLLHKVCYGLFLLLLLLLLVELKVEYLLLPSTLLTK